jgi:AcrR family transcriptional regulator
VSDTGDRIIDATMRLLADRAFEEVTLQAIADEADVGLDQLAAHFPTRGHILDAFARRIDREVLARDFTDMADESPRDRLFDVLMSRLDSLSPYRGAIRTLMRAVRRDPAIGLGLNAISVRSANWMLAAAGIAPTGWRGRLVVQGLAVSFARVLRVFVDEEDPGLPRTMAALDKELREAEDRYRRFSRFLGDGVRPARPRPAPVPDAEIVPDEPAPATDPVTPAADMPTPDAPAADAPDPGPAARGDTLAGGPEATPDTADPSPEPPLAGGPETDRDRSDSLAGG